MLDSGAELPQVENKKFDVPLTPLKPTGEVTLPSVNAVMKDPYYDPSSSRLLALTTAIFGFGAILGENLGSNKEKGRKENKKMSRRQFLKFAAVFGGALTALATSGEIIRKEIMKALSDNQRLYSLFTDFPLLKNYWLREKRGTLDYKKRLELDDVLGIFPDGKTNIFQNGKQVGIIHDFRLRSVSNLQSLGRWAEDRSDSLVNTHLMVYELSQGKLKPKFNPNPKVVSSRVDEMHKLTKAPMLALFNATAPQALGMCRAIEITDPSTPDSYVAPIVYGSSSVFIPQGIKSDSPIWDHAKSKTKSPNSLFKELTMRVNDPSHQAIGFCTNGEVRLVPQMELFKIIEEKKLTSDLDSLALNQFCFDPRTDEIPEDFQWSHDIHRNLNVLLVATDGRQMIMSSSLDVFFSNKDYNRIIKQVEKNLGVALKVACCLDVGLASGFMIEKEGKIVKPVEPSFNDPDGGLNMGLVHTSSIYLIQDTNS